MRYFANAGVVLLSVLGSLACCVPAPQAKNADQTAKKKVETVADPDSEPLAKAAKEEPAKKEDDPKDDEPPPPPVKKERQVFPDGKIALYQNETLGHDALSYFEEMFGPADVQKSHSIGTPFTNRPAVSLVYQGPKIKAILKPVEPWQKGVEVTHWRLSHFTEPTNSFEVSPKVAAARMESLTRYRIVPEVFVAQAPKVPDVGSKPDPKPPVIITSSSPTAPVYRPADPILPSTFHGGVVHVRDYTRKDGTHVSAHTRRR